MPAKIGIKLRKSVKYFFLDIVIYCRKVLMTLNLPLICFSKKKKKLYGPFFFYGWGSTASRLEPLRGGSLLFTICILKFAF